MKASYRWLRELLPDLDASPREVAERLTSAGLEVEGISEFGVATESCLVVRVIGARPHPTKSGLKLVMVERAPGVTQEIVCGAPNVPAPGGLCVLAPLGTHLPAKGMTIDKRAIGGVESEGMLCSESELGLGEDHDGIIVLAEGAAEIGTPFSVAFPNARDTIFEIGLTPNRPDGLGHVGLARELAALYGMPFVFPTDVVSRVSDIATSSVVSIAVEDAERCPHYGAAGAVDVTIGPSPLWAKYRLQALGVRSISNVVDVTNLVMLEYGHPLHAFDLDRVGKGQIVVRRAKEGEKLKTLDGVDRTLVADDLLICDGDGPVALAGVMGGASSEIQASTRRVLFECAWFDPRGVRRTGRRHGMHTESSHRFERGVDPSDVVAVLDRTVALTIELAGGLATKGRIHVQGKSVAAEPAPPEKRTVRLRGHRIGDVLGVDVPLAEAGAILKRLGCEVSKSDPDGPELEVVVPTHRPDLGREIDLIEEVIRVHGIDRVPAELPAIRASRDVGGQEELLRRARAVCTEIGLSEAITFSFTAENSLAALSAPKPAVILANPLGEHHAVMRTTLLVGLLDAVKNARRHGERDVREFALGPVFLAPPEGSEANARPEERLRLAMVLAGDRKGWLEKPKPLDVWDLKGHALEIARRLSGQAGDIVAADKEAPPHLHPRAAALLLVGDRRVGSLGLLHPDVVDALELDGEVFVLEMDLAPFVAGPLLPRYAAIPRFPASIRDVAFIVRDEFRAGDVERAVREAAGALAEDVTLFDRYVGEKIQAGSSNLAFRIVYRAPDRTLTDAEVDAAHASVEKAVNERFGATLRA